MLAERLIAETVAKHGVPEGRVTMYADRPFPDRFGSIEDARAFCPDVLHMDSGDGPLRTGGRLRRSPRADRPTTTDPTGVADRRVEVPLQSRAGRSVSPVRHPRLASPALRQPYRHTSRSASGSPMRQTPPHEHSEFEQAC